MVDVLVIGGGPGGAVAAKICAQHGLSTLLLEKKRLPRHKVCGGFMPSNLARVIIDREFGVIPDWVLTDPPYILGFISHQSSGDKRQDLKSRPHDLVMPHALRRDLDYWMVQKAKEAGAEILDEAHVADIIQGSNMVTLKIRRSKEEQEKQARFVIGADGPTSITRKNLFPALNVRYNYNYQEYFLGALETLDRRYNHQFSFNILENSHASGSFSVVHKRGLFAISVDDVGRPIRQAVQLAKQILAEKWGFNLNNKPVFSGGCAVAALLEDLYSRKFLPAKVNVLLVGDAAGFATPTDVGKDNKAQYGEGINLALKSGILAAKAIIKAADTSCEAASIYLTELQQLISVMKTIDRNIVLQNDFKKRDKILDELI